MKKFFREIHIGEDQPGRSFDIGYSGEENATVVFFHFLNREPDARHELFLIDDQGATVQFPLTENYKWNITPEFTISKATFYAEIISYFNDGSVKKYNPITFHLSKGK